MEELIKAIVAHYLTNPGGLKAGTPGGMWPHPAPQQVSGIFISYRIISGPEEWTMDTGDSILPLIQFTIATSDVTPAALYPLAQKFKDAYVDQLLTLSGWATVRADCINEALDDVLDDKGYMYRLDMRFRIQKQ